MCVDSITQANEYHFKEKEYCYKGQISISIEIGRFIYFCCLIVLKNIQLTKLGGSF